MTGRALRLGNLELSPEASERGVTRSIPRLTIVVPCFNEEEVLPESCRRLLEVVDGLTSAGKIQGDSEVVFVDDGSKDCTWSIICEANRVDGRVRGVKLSSNRGHQTALVAGLFASTGDAVVSIDADLQDDLGAIESMVDCYVAGSDIVYGVRRLRETDTKFKRITAESYYRILALFGVKIVHNHADFRLLSRRSLEALKQYTEANLFLRGIIPLLGYPSKCVYFDRSARFAGESKYPLRKMLSLAIDGVTSFTAFPLRLIALLGIGVSLLSIGMVLWVLWAKFLTGAVVPGWASSVIPIYFLGGLQLLSVGVLGEYVARLYTESKQRPRYFIEETV